MRYLWGFIAVGFLFACSDEVPGWTAFVYPDRQNVPIGSEIKRYAVGHYASLKECRSGASRKIEEIWRPNGPVPAYECGYHCGERAEFGGMFVCMKIRR